MLLFDLAIVALLALALPGDLRRVGGAVAIYSLGVLALSGIVLGRSDIDEAPLALARFDLVPALLVLAAVLARERERSATWSAAAGDGGRRQGLPARSVPGAAARRAEPATGRRSPPPCRSRSRVAIVLASRRRVRLGDQLPHRARAPDRVAWRRRRSRSPRSTTSRAAPSSARAASTSPGPGPTSPARIIVGLLVFLYGAASCSPAGATAASPTCASRPRCSPTIVILSPVLSPQFLFWLLPLSAAAYGFGLANWVLLASFVLTQLMLQQYARVVGRLRRASSSGASPGATRCCSSTWRWSSGRCSARAWRSSRARAAIAFPLTAASST